MIGRGRVWSSIIGQHFVVMNGKTWGVSTTDEHPLCRLWGLVIGQRLAVVDGDWLSVGCGDWRLVVFRLW